MFHGAASLEVFESVGHQPKTESTNPFWAQCLMVFANTHYTVFWASEKRKTALNTCSVMAYINIFHLSTTKSCSNKLFPVTFISLFISEKPRPSQS